MIGVDRHPDRLAELLAGEASGDLSGEERRELTTLLAHNPGGNRDAYLHATGVLQLGLLKRDERARQHLPRALEERLLQHAEIWSSKPAAPVAALADARRRRAAPVQMPAPAAAARGRTGWTWQAVAGWAVAASLVFILVTGRVASVKPAADTAPATLRTALLRDAPDVRTVPWGTSDQPGYASVHGDVVWSDQRQEGYLRLAGLPANDRSRAQYQLWIVAPRRDAHPVDGGVFDVPAGGEVIIPIHAKLAVADPKAFAITLERPGGVVVSAGPLLVVAARS